MPARKKSSSPTLGDLGRKITQIKANQLMYAALLIVVFLLGYFVSESQFLKKNGAPTTAPTQGGEAQAPAITNDDIKAWAKEVGLDQGKFNSCFDANTHQAKVDKDLADGQTAGVTGTPTFYINGIQLVGALPYQAFKDEIEKAIAGTQTGTAVTVDVGDLPMLGKDSAQVTIVEFSDFQFPFCNRFCKEAFPSIKKDYIDTGKVKFYFRHYPLPGHPLATPFANAAECANEQGKFWDFHDKIFDSQ